MIEIAALIIAFFGLLGGIIGVYVTIQTRLTKIEAEIKSMDNKFDDIKDERIEMFKMFNTSIEKIWEKLDKIDTKLDLKFEDLAVIKAEHKRNICIFSPQEKKDK